MPCVVRSPSHGPCRPRECKKRQETGKKLLAAPVADALACFATTTRWNGSGPLGWSHPSSRRRKNTLTSLAADMSHWPAADQGDLSSDDKGPSASFRRRGPRRPPPKPPPRFDCAGKARARTRPLDAVERDFQRVARCPTWKCSTFERRLCRRNDPGGRFRQGGEAPLRVERTGSTPRARTSGAALQLDPSRRSRSVFADGLLERNRRLVVNARPGGYRGRA